MVRAIAAIDEAASRIALPEISNFRNEDMPIEVTHVGITPREMGTSTVTEIGGHTETGVLWRLAANDFRATEHEYYVDAGGGRRITVECHKNREHGYHYFIALGLEEHTDLLRRLPPLP
jgi:hypothetical protein